MLTEDATMTIDGLDIIGDVTPEFAEILTPKALTFVASLERAFDVRRRELLYLRDGRQAEIDAGFMPDFLPGTEHIRDSEWTVAPIPPDLEDRRVEITGPVDRKMIINALNSGANVFMADFEDSHSPTWAGTIEGQINLLMEDAATAEISRSQIWQWLHNPHTQLEDGRPITPELFHETIVDVLAELKGQVGEEFFATHNFELAAELFEEITIKDKFTDFLTLKAYEHLD